MPLTPEDVVRKTFPQARFRGYVTAEVDAFLDEVVAELQHLNQLIDNLRAEQVAGRASQPPEERRTTIETAQLEQVRRERSELVEEIAVLQERYEGLKAQIGDLGRA